jgi:hypothetical protein
VPAWLRPTRGESRWPVAVAIVVAAVLQLLTPPELAFAPGWLLPTVELALLAALLIANPYRISRESTVLHGAGLVLVALATLATVWSVGRLVVVLLGTVPYSAKQVLLNAAVIWVTNVIVFAIWYWETDRGGPAARAAARQSHPDFMFPQMTTPELAERDWEPAFVDYLYVAFTNSTAFSPTDTMPVSRWAKLAMMAQAAISVTVVVLGVARAVNLLQ